MYMKCLSEKNIQPELSQADVTGFCILVSHLFCMVSCLGTAMAQMIFSRWWLASKRPLRLFWTTGLGLKVVRIISRSFSPPCPSSSCSFWWTWVAQQVQASFSSSMKSVLTTISKLLDNSFVEGPSFNSLFLLRHYSVSRQHIYHVLTFKGIGLTFLKPSLKCECTNEQTFL